ncbi:MAG: hypothetical protein HYT14_01475 [Candidatus Liptonbacteria bacterium]|nr:hypothetical protein [Candidatus Liptonbacteria bacterium]
MKTFFDWARPLVAHILDMPQLTPEEINRVIVFAQLTDGLPLLPRDVHAAALFLERQWSVFQKRPGHILRFAQLNDKELRFFEAFYTFSRDKKQILCFLSWMRALKGQLVTANPALIRATGLDLVSLRKSLPQIH